MPRARSGRDRCSPGSTDNQRTAGPAARLIRAPAGGCLIPGRGQQPVDAHCWYGGRPQEALAVVTAQLSGERDLLTPLDAFDGDLQPQFDGCRGQRPDEHVVGPGPQGGRERAVDLDPVHGQPEQISQTRTTRYRSHPARVRSQAIGPSCIRTPRKSECNGRAVSVTSSCTVVGETPASLARSTRSGHPVVLVEVPSGEVDAHPSAPDGCAATRLSRFQGRPRDGDIEVDDEVGSFGDRHEGGAGSRTRPSGRIRRASASSPMILPVLRSTIG